MEGEVAHPRAQRPAAPVPGAARGLRCQASTRRVVATTSAGVMAESRSAANCCAGTSPSAPKALSLINRLAKVVAWARKKYSGSGSSSGARLNARLTEAVDGAAGAQHGGHEGRAPAAGQQLIGSQLQAQQVGGALERQHRGADQELRVCACPAGQGRQELGVQRRHLLCDGQ